MTVRLLHHYDEIGVLAPSGRSDAGYRLYSHEDLKRLQEILVWRQLGFPLAEIKALVGGAGHDRGRALKRQRELVAAELGRLRAVARALDEANAAHQNGTKVKETTMFDGFDQSRYEDEVQEQWGETDAYRESARRTAAYGEAEWEEIKTEAAAINSDFVSLMGAGEPAEDDAARAVAERHRRHISRWFYECTPSFHRGLAEMYIADPRFRATYEREAAGLSAYVHDAIVANAAELSR